MNITIRKAETKDFSAVLELLHEFARFQGSADKVSITLEQMMRDQNLFHCFVAETKENDIVGFANVFFAYYSWTGKALYLDDLYVTESFRTQGVGKKLLIAVTEFAREQNCKKLKWQVSKWNNNAIAFYKSLGAEIDEIEINCELRITN